MKLQQSLEIKVRLTAGLRCEANLNKTEASLTEEVGAPGGNKLCF